MVTQQKVEYTTLKPSTHHNSQVAAKNLCYYPQQDILWSKLILLSPTIIIVRITHFFSNNYNVAGKNNNLLQSLKLIVILCI